MRDGRLEYFAGSYDAYVQVRAHSTCLVVGQATSSSRQTCGTCAGRCGARLTHACTCVRPPRRAGQGRGGPQQGAAGGAAGAAKGGAD
jgi:hypothetical protein